MKAVRRESYLCHLPHRFTSAPVSAELHKHGIWFLRYLDDGLLLASSYQEALNSTQFLLQLCGRLGIRMNFDISFLRPAQELVFEGFPDEVANRQSSLLSPSFLGFTTPDCQGVANLAGPHGVPYLLGFQGSAVYVESAVSPSVSVVQLYTRQLGVHCLDPPTTSWMLESNLLAGRDL